MDPWRAVAACRYHPNTVWYTDDPPTVALAKAICGRCPARRDCYRFALATGERVGIWAGIDMARRSHATEAVDDQADYDTIERAITADLTVGPELGATVCRRCGEAVKAGLHPRDGNGPGAQCGKTATYNKGCRCDRCEEAKRASNLAGRPTAPLDLTAANRYSDA